MFTLVLNTDVGQTRALVEKMWNFRGDRFCHAGEIEERLFVLSVKGERRATSLMNLLWIFEELMKERRRFCVCVAFVSHLYKAAFSFKSHSGGCWGSVSKGRPSFSIGQWNVRIAWRRWNAEDPDRTQNISKDLWILCDTKMEEMWILYWWVTERCFLTFSKY